MRSFQWNSRRRGRRRRGRRRGRRCPNSVHDVILVEKSFYMVWR